MLTGPANRHDQRPLSADVLATLAVAGFSVAVALGFARVFSDWEFMDDFVAIVVAGHGVGLLLRRLRTSAIVAVPVGALALAWVVAALYYRDTFSWGLPTSETWSMFRFELTSVREQFSVALAPVIYGAGWDVLAAVGLAISVLLADAFAFRAFARAETLVPGGVLFVFVGALGDDRLRVALTVVLIAAGVVTTVILRSYHAPEHARVPRAAALRRILPATAATVLVVSLGAAYIGPRLPGATAEALYDTRGRGGGVTEVVNPLVDIRSRLTNRSDEELFRVQADIESYWRSSALPEFDGTTWSLPEQDLDPNGPVLTVTGAGGVQNRQRVMISALRGSLVPAAAEPVEASPRGALGWVPATSTLVKSDGDLDEGDVFEVVSLAPVLDASILESATSTDPGAAIYTALPDDLPGDVEATARQVTAGATSTYEAARLLQSWFQLEFEYSLEVQSGHGNHAIEAFLRERVGYCEQFAGTYAAMMRTLGHPARVAVGFTSGSLGEDGIFSVRGRNAHAWPEVWFDGIGWVAFEPTPGRGAPNAEAYTGLPPQQDATAAEPSTQTGTEAGAPPVTTVATGRPTQPGVNIPEEFADPTGADDVVEPVTDREFDPVPFVGVFAIVALLLLPAIVRRVRSRVGGGGIEAQLARMWSDSVGAVRGAGVPVHPAATPLETAAATAAHLPIVARPFGELARVVTEATYGVDGVAGYDVVSEFGSSTVRQCHHWSRQVDRAVNESTSLGQRVRRYFTVWR